MWFWHPSKEEIENWIESKEKEFTEEENRNHRLSTKDWLKRYIFSDIHEVFFANFPTELLAWLSILEENKTSTCSERLAEWTLEVIQRLKKTDNSISRAVDFWLNNLLEGFITEFAIDTLKAYSEAERLFFKGYHGKYLSSLSFWIKMFLCEQGVLRLDACIVVSCNA
jgi:hypothetical protein